MTKWLIACAGVLLLGTAQAADAPKFQVDPSWPKPLPNNWIMGLQPVSPWMRRITSGWCSARAP